jgi:hypothetical protein
MSIELYNFKNEFHFIMRFLKINFNKFYFYFFPSQGIKIHVIIFGRLNIKKFS